MSTRPPEPEFLIQWREWMHAGPPKCSHTCEFYDVNGTCVVFFMEPPEDFAATPSACSDWEGTIPF